MRGRTRSASPASLAQVGALRVHGPNILEVQAQLLRFLQLVVAQQDHRHPGLNERTAAWPERLGNKTALCGGEGQNRILPLLRDQIFMSVMQTCRTFSWSPTCALKGYTRGGPKYFRPTVSLYHVITKKPRLCAGRAVSGPEPSGPPEGVKAKCEERICQGTDLMPFTSSPQSRCSNSLGACGTANSLHSREAEARSRGRSSSKVERASLGGWHQLW